VIPKPSQDIGEEDLLALIEQGRDEGPQLDFKRDLPKDDHDGRKAFYADICAFANSSGGDLVYGIEEKDGVASALVPQTIPGTADGYVLKLTSSIRDRIEPVLHGVQIRPVPLATGGHALVIRVPRSFSGIHRSKIDGQFYVRKSRSNDPLDVPGIVNRVSDHLGREDRVTSFFARRYADILSNEHQLPLAAGSKLVVHLVPARDFLSGEEIDLPAISIERRIPFLLSDQSHSERNTWDGRAFFSADEEKASHFTLFMRSGVVESCRDITPSFLPEEHRAHIDLGWMEESILDFLRAFEAGAFATQTTGYPYLVRVALLGTNGLSATAGGRFGARRNTYGLPVRQPLPVLALPAVLVEGPSNIEHEMHAAFLRMWHAWAFPRCMHYDLKDGIWCRRKTA
jgi:hypothetical protein